MHKRTRLDGFLFIEMILFYDTYNLHCCSILCIISHNTVELSNSKWAMHWYFKPFPKIIGYVLMPQDVIVIPNNEMLGMSDSDNIWSGRIKFHIF